MSLWMAIFAASMLTCTKCISFLHFYNNPHCYHDKMPHTPCRIACIQTVLWDLEGTLYRSVPPLQRPVRHAGPGAAGRAPVGSRAVFSRRRVYCTGVRDGLRSPALKIPPRPDRHSRPAPHSRCKKCRLAVVAGSCAETPRERSVMTSCILHLLNSGCVSLQRSLVWANCGEKFPVH